MAGRPIKYNVNMLLGAIKAYTNGTEIPILKEFCYQNDILEITLYKISQREGNERLLYSIKRLLHKKEVQLERLGLEGKVDKTMAIFSLKQLGWRDKMDIDTTSKGEKIGKFDTKGIAKDIHALLYGRKNDTEGDGKAEGEEGNGSK